MLGLIVRTGHHGKVMSIGEGILVRCVEVGRIVVVSIDGFRKFIQSGSRNVILHILSRVLPVRDILGTVGVPVLMEPVGEVADDGQPVERLDGEFGRVGEVGLPVHIDVLALREGQHLLIERLPLQEIVRLFVIGEVIKELAMFV